MCCYLIFCVSKGGLLEVAGAEVLRFLQMLDRRQQTGKRTLKITINFFLNVFFYSRVSNFTKKDVDIKKMLRNVFVLSRRTAQKPRRRRNVKISRCGRWNRPLWRRIATMWRIMQIWRRWRSTVDWRRVRERFGKRWRRMARRLTGIQWRTVRISFFYLIYDV